MVVIRIVVGVLILAHGLVHLLYMARDVPEFSSGVFVAGSRVSTPTGRAGSHGDHRGRVRAGRARTMGVPGLSGIWPALTIAAASLSLVLLVAFWSSWLILGVAIDIALIAIAAIRPGWVQHIVA